MAAMTSSNSNFQNPRKTYKVYILEIIRAKFHQNRFSRLGCSADTDRQTHAHTHTNTHIHTTSVRSQHIQSKWLNIKRWYISASPWAILFLSKTWNFGWLYPPNARYHFLILYVTCQILKWMPIYLHWNQLSYDKDIW